jgi:hypothetical protein
MDLQVDNYNVIITTLTLIISVVLFLILGYKYYNKKYNIISLKESLDLTGLPIITFTVGDSKYNFVLDSGASRSIINLESLEKIPHGELEESDCYFYGIDGKMKEGDAATISLIYNDKEIKNKFIVNDLSSIVQNLKQETGVNITGILGNDFMQKNKYILDFNKLVAYNKKR